MPSTYPRLIDRFPASSEEFFRWRFQDALLEELCRDYDRVMLALEAETEKADQAASAAETRQELLALSRKLEYEYLERIANNASSKDRTLGENRS